LKIIGLVLSCVIGTGCRYFDIPAASPPVIPGALIVLAMTLGYSSMDRLVANKNPIAVATTKHFCGGPTGLPVTESRASVNIFSGHLDGGRGVEGSGSK
jgi:XapX domain-containing protein